MPVRVGCSSYSKQAERFGRIQPALTIEPGQRSGNYRLGTDTVLTNDKGESNIRAENFAMAVLDELETPKHLKSQMTIAAN